MLLIMIKILRKLKLLNKNKADCWNDFIEQSLTYQLDVCLSVHRCICVEKKNQLDVTEWFIAVK